jgi:hypothetical protein
VTTGRRQDEIFICVALGSTRDFGRDLVYIQPSLTFNFAGRNSPRNFARMNESSPWEMLSHTFSMKIIYRIIAISVVMWAAKTIAERFKQKAGRLNRNEEIDQMSIDSFPSSDPPSSWAGVSD